MNEQQMERYFETHAVDGALPDAEMVKLLTGTADEAAGETGDTMDGDAPTPAEAEEVKPEAATPDEPEAETPQAQEQQPVIMAKDGRNTIPYSELADAREAAQNERSQREALQRELEALKAKYEGDAAQGDEEAAAENGEDGEADDPLARLREDWPEVAEAVEKAAARHQRVIEEQRLRIEELTRHLLPIQQGEAERRMAAHYSTILNAHPDADEIMESEAFAKWREAQPSFVREVQEAVLQQGTAEQVVELFGSFKAATGWSNDAAAGDTAAQARREAARQAKQAGHATPKSLSDIPGGAAVQTDATETFLQMSDTARMDKIMGMSPEQIENMLRRAT